MKTRTFFFVVKFCIKHVGLVKNVVFLINNCLGAMSILLLSGIWLLPGTRLSFSPDWYPSDYYPVSGKMVFGTSLIISLYKGNFICVCMKCCLKRLTEEVETIIYYGINSKGISPPKSPKLSKSC